VLKQGDTYYIPPHIVHGAVALEVGVLVDVFAPFREDFV
jgi:quercetin dioxygenase-like cupin family protein